MPRITSIGLSVNFSGLVFYPRKPAGERWTAVVRRVVVERATLRRAVRGLVVESLLGDPALRYVVHNLVAHPLLVLRPVVGERWHERTSP